MFDAMESGELRALYVIGENPAQSEADQKHAIELLEGLDHLVVQDIFLTKTAQLADVVLPASASWAEAEGTVTSSERRVQRVRKALDPPGEARDDVEIVYELGKRLGVDLGCRAPRTCGTSCAASRRCTAACGTTRLEELGGIQWPCWDETHPGRAVPARAAVGGRGRGCRAPFNAVVHDPPVDVLDDDFPIRLTTGRRLESFNTGVQTGGFSSPLHRGGTAIRLAPEDGARYGVADGGRVRVVSRRGSIEAPAAYDDTLRPGLAFMNLHFPDEVATNVLDDRRAATRSRARPSSRRPRSAWRRVVVPTCACSRPSRRTPSARRSTPSSARPPTTTAASRAATGRDGTCCSPRSAPRSAASAG